MRTATLRELADRDGTRLPRGLREDGWTFDGPLDFIDNYLELVPAGDDARGLPPDRE